MSVMSMVREASGLFRQRHRAMSSGKPKHVWRVYVPNPGDTPRGVLVDANTKSEARAAVKRQVGLKRLPAGTVCEKVV